MEKGRKQMEDRKANMPLKTLNNERCSEVCYKDPDRLRFEKVTKLERDEFEDIYEIMCVDLAKPFEESYEQVGKEE